jgi:ring-1,2-phenylacetyl-CoA epoxidase subunit PaaC
VTGGAVIPQAAGLALALADDELVLGYRLSEWTGVAPLLEEDVALSSIAQDEIGHARALYALCAALGRPNGGEPEAAAVDTIAYDRPASGFRHARLCERPRGDWGEEIARRALYEVADAVRLVALERSRWTALAELVAKIAREETYHLEHARAWLDRLSRDAEGRRRLQAGLDALWPDALGLFEPLAGEPALVAAGVLPVPSGELREAFVAAMGAELTERALDLPPSRDAVLGGRRGEHSPAFAEQHAEMTMVRASEPQAAW